MLSKMKGFIFDAKIDSLWNVNRSETGAWPVISTLKYFLREDHGFFSQLANEGSFCHGARNVRR